MTLEMLNYSVAWPEMFLLIMACVVLIADVFTTDEKRQSTYQLSQLTLVVTLLLIGFNSSEQREYAFNGAFVSDQLASVLKFSVVAIVGIVFVYSREYLLQRNIFKGEFYVLGLFSTLGMMIMISASHFLSLYLGLELLSLSLYAMVAFDRDNPNASEAAMKYFVLGAIASGMLLYGISMIYGVSGSLDLRQVAVAIAQQQQLNIVMVF
ncbi:MAG: NADH:ubiquinone oxidoreductase subunit N, partial [Gammaproteobacteria bacterium]|nr:NADH:ubiquinone oxidoreductase subunit N [Gammaproteobacteria bacterium]